MKHLSLTLSLFFLITLGAFAQSMVDDKQLEENYISSKTTPVNKGYKNTNGSIYMDEEFKIGSVVVNGKVVSSNVGLRYNVQGEEIELKKKVNSAGTVANVLKKDSNIHVTIANQTLVYLPSSDDDMRAGYFIVIQEGDKISLYNKLSKEYVPGKVSVNSIARSVPDTFKEKVSLYIKMSDGTITQVPNSKSKRKKIFQNQEQTMQDFIKKKKLNLRNDTDFKIALNFYNNL